MNRDKLILSLFLYCFSYLLLIKSNGIVAIYISRGKNSSYTLEIKDTSTNHSMVLENCSSSMLKNWQVVEIYRRKAYKDNKSVDVYDVDKKTSFKHISILDSLNQQEIAEAVEKQAKRAVNIRRRMVVDTPYRKRTKKIDTRVFDLTRYASSTGRGV